MQLCSKKRWNAAVAGAGSLKIVLNAEMLACIAAADQGLQNVILETSIAAADQRLQNVILETGSQIQAKALQTDEYECMIVDRARRALRRGKVYHCCS